MTLKINKDGSRYIKVNGHDIFGYCRYAKFYYDIVLSAEPNSHFVEVGSFLGQSTAIMSRLIQISKKNITFDCVDLFEITDFSDEKHKEYVSKYGGDLYEAFINNLKLSKTFDTINTIHKKMSTKASQYYRDLSLDFVYLDASHKYEDVFNDIQYWWDKVKVGGLLAGDDWEWDSVMKAVRHSFRNNEVKITDYGTWIVEKKVDF